MFQCDLIIMYISVKVVCVFFFALIGCVLVGGDINVEHERVELTDVESNLINTEDVGDKGNATKNLSTGGVSGEVSCPHAADGESIVNCHRDNFSQDVDNKKTRNESTAEDVGVRLILTEMIEAGNISEARRLSRVSGGPFPAHIPSYSGYFTVNPKFNSNLFFWFFPCETAYEDAPVLLWLQGGPGDSSLMGLFNELGPFSVAADGSTLAENPNSWHKDHSIIFIDNPVGTGFSFTDHEDGYARNHTEIGDSLYTAMIQFFKLFPELQKNAFFLTGVSYAGKYIPTLGHIIHTRNQDADLKINLHGIAVGNGYTDPISMTEFHKTAYQMGLVDSYVRDNMVLLEQQIQESLLNGDLLIAAKTKSFNLQLFGQHSHFTYGYNLLHASEPYKEYGFAIFFKSADVRMRIHVGDTEFTTDEEQTTRVFNILYPQNMVSVKPLLEELLEHYRVLYYSGQMDLICTYPQSLRMYHSLNWSAVGEYERAERIPWYVDEDVAGYMKTAGKFTEVLVRNAGHVVPYDQPVWARDLITRFTSDYLP